MALFGISGIVPTIKLGKLQARKDWTECLTKKSVHADVMCDLDAMYTEKRSRHRSNSRQSNRPDSLVRLEGESK